MRNLSFGNFKYYKTLLALLEKNQFPFKRATPYPFRERMAMPSSKIEKAFQRLNVIAIDCGYDLSAGSLFFYDMTHFKTIIQMDKASKKPLSDKKRIVFQRVRFWPTGDQFFNIFCTMGRMIKKPL